MRTRSLADVNPAALEILPTRLKKSVVVADNDCWLWQAGRDPHGYGRLGIGGRTWLAHRAAYETFVGPIPDGLQLDHLCRNPSCVNPEHLEPVTNRENTMRGLAPIVNGEWNRSKTHCKHGHEFTPRNVYIRANGNRACRECRVRWSRERYARTKK